jgi:hypothetical protein
MIQSNRLTIIPSDGAVYLDNYVTIDLDLSGCGIPPNVHALQWLNNKGHIEDISNMVHNIEITELPEWALKCVAVCEEDYKLKSAAGMNNG